MLSKGNIGHRADELARNIFWIVWIAEKPRLLMVNNVGNAADRTRHNRNTSRHGLQKDVSEPFRD